MILNETLCELNAIITEHSDCNCLIGGDFNTNLDGATCTSDVINNFISSKNFSRCDVLFPVSDGFTYFNDTTHCSSVIDYMLTSENDSTIAFNVLEMDINLSDHRPIMAVFVCHLTLETIGVTVTPHSKSEIAHFRWDNAPLESYLL
jgi:endonuclease/exonuclease/phosphatase (EEP) superfamily protein YafD